MAIVRSQSGSFGASDIGVADVAVVDDILENILRDRVGCGSIEPICKLTVLKLPAATLAVLFVPGESWFEFDGDLLPL